MEGFEKYVESKRLLVPPNMKAKGAALLEGVVEYRNKQVTHFNNPRMLHATIIDADGRAQINKFPIYPKPTDVQVESPQIEELALQVESYVSDFVLMIKSNRDKSKFTLLRKLEA
jgi:hypothetical protein